MERNRENQKGKSCSKKAMRLLLSAAVWLVVWQLVSLAVGQETLVAPPAAVFSRLAVLLTEPSFWLRTASTLWRIAGGYLLGALCGILLAVLTGASELLYALFEPLLSVVRATPVVSFILLALVWMKRGSVPVFISMLMVLPIVWANLSLGLRETDRELLEMARVYRLGRLKTFRHIVLPSVLPALLTALATAAGFAWKAGVAAEVLSTPKNAVGTQLYDARVYLESADLFAWTAVVVVLSLFFEKLIVRAVREISRRVSKDVVK